MSERRKAERRKLDEAVAENRRSKQRRTKDRRITARAPLDLWVEEEKGEELYFRRTGNISIGGIYFEQAVPHPLGTRVRVRFALPGSPEVVEVDAEIVNALDSDVGMGMEFLGLDDEQKKQIARFVKKTAEAS
ncbi:MAG: hypothetical protein GY822_31990 [Deltaproteobacteria bacterium]|nr:hypothetical protein [Deltaproteobacteria bacterium]